MKTAIYKSVLLIIVFLCIGFTQAVAAAKVEMLVQTDWLASHLNDAGMVVLHIAETPNAYNAGHIPGARLLSWGEITIARNGVPNQLPAVDVLKAALERVGVGDETTVVVYGDSPLQASFGYFVLDYLGHSDHVALLDGGVTKWKAEQRTLETAKPQAKPGTLAVKAKPELVIDLTAMQKIAAEKKLTVIDGRPRDQFTGAVPGDGIKRGGHIPGAKNIFWQQLLLSKDNPVLKPVSEIRSAYERLGVKTDQTTVVYCRTGMIATHEYFTLKLAGFRPVVYSASFMEWSNTPATQVETGAAGQ